MKKLSILFLLALSLIGSKMPAQTAIERLRSAYPALMEQYGSRLEQQHADYVIAIDVSGSMKKPEMQKIVIPAMTVFIESIPEGDYVSIIRFGTKAEPVGMDGVINEKNRDYYIGLLSSTYTEANSSLSGSTNLPAMCEAICKNLTRAEANNLQYVFMFTDFQNSTGGNNWERVKKMGEGLSGRNIIRAFAVQLPGTPTHLKDVREVFPNLQSVLAKDASMLKSWFESQKTEIYVNRLRDMIVGDKDLWVANNYLNLGLRLRTNHNLQLAVNMDEKVPSFVRAVTVDSCDLMEYKKVASVKLFAKDQRIERGEKSNIGTVKYIDTKWPWVTGSYVKLRVPCSLEFQKELEQGAPSFQEEIVKLGIADKMRFAPELTAENNFVIQWNIWLFSICCGLLVAWLWLFIMNTLRRHRLGYLNLLIRDGSGNTQVHQLPNKRKVTVGANNCDISVPSIASSLVLKGLSGSPLSLIKRRVMAECKCPPTSADFISIGGQPKKSNKFHRLKLQQAATISSLGVLNFSVGERDAKKSNLKYVIACVLFVLVTLAALAFCLFF